MTEPVALPERYGATKIKTIRRDFDRHREAIRLGDRDEIEETWLACERWVDFVFAMAVQKPGEPPR